MKLKQHKSPFPQMQYYTAGELQILKAIEDGRLHISVSHAKRLPTWDEMKEVREKLTPDEKTMAMIMPPKAQYVNVHEYCFHLWELDCNF